MFMMSTKCWSFICMCSFLMFSVWMVSESQLADNQCPQILKKDNLAAGKESFFAFKRLGATIAWPSSMKHSWHRHCNIPSRTLVLTSLHLWILDRIAWNTHDTDTAIYPVEHLCWHHLHLWILARIAWNTHDIDTATFPVEHLHWHHLGLQNMYPDSMTPSWLRHCNMPRTLAFTSPGCTSTYLNSMKHLWHGCHKSACQSLANTYLK